MGGYNETKINGIRLHVVSGDVHIHDDLTGNKVVIDNKTFKKEINSAFKQLQNNEGVCRIPGRNGYFLYILKDEFSYNMFVSGTSIKTALLEFIRSN